MEEPIFTIPPDLIRHPETFTGIRAEAASWVMEKMNVAKLRGLHDGRGVTIGIIDTGVDPNHPDLKGNHKASKSFVPGENAYDGNGHGSHCSGTCASTNPRLTAATGAKFVHGKGLSNGGSGAGTWIRDAMKWCHEEQGAMILSMSLGSPREDPTITRMCRDLSEAGVWIFAAGGNSGNTPNTDWPGQSPYVISVAAIDSNFRRAAFSNTGDKIDTSDGGVMITSCRPGGGYVDLSGTSMATPNAASKGACFMGALVEAKLPIPKIEGLRKLLHTRSVDLGTPGDDREYGPGYMDPVMLFLAAQPLPN